METQKHIIISLGGSLIVTDALQIEFLKKFKEYIDKKVLEGYQCIIFTGGGKIARNYVEALSYFDVSKNEDKDWLGIAATRINAEFLRSIFGASAYEEVVTDPTIFPVTNKKVIIGCGWKPGSSSDRPPVEIAKVLGEKNVVNLSNIDYVYTADPKKNPDAKKLENISWREYLTFIPHEWTPSMNTPFDPVSAQIAEENGVSVGIINGVHLDAIDLFLENKSFLGTRIHP